MTVALGDIVKFKDSSGGEIGRVCKDNKITVCVKFEKSGCLRVAKSDLEVTTGKAPECDEACKQGC